MSFSPAYRTCMEILGFRRERCLCPSVRGKMHLILGLYPGLRNIWLPYDVAFAAGCPCSRAVIMRDALPQGNRETLCSLKDYSP